MYLTVRSTCDVNFGKIINSPLRGTRFVQWQHGPVVWELACCAGGSHNYVGSNLGMAIFIFFVHFFLFRFVFHCTFLFGLFPFILTAGPKQPYEIFVIMYF